jgi:hypothetical protein
MNEGARAMAREKSKRAAFKTEGPESGDIAKLG